MAIIRSRSAIGTEPPGAVFAPSAFVVCQFATSKLVGDEYVQRPKSVVHAKQHGTTVTMCGRSALTWYKFFDLPFESYKAERCRECLSELRRLGGQA